MLTPLPWLLIAAALALAGDRSRRDHAPDARRRTRRRRDGDARTGRRASRRTLGLGAAGAAAASSIAIAGPHTGTLAAGILAPAAAVIAVKLADSPAPSRPDAALALALDLAAAALRSGQSVPSALSLTAPVLPAALAAQWRRTAALLALGAEPGRAWAALGEDVALAPVAVAAGRSADSGARLARTFTQLAADTRAEVQADALARANRAGVFAMAPLGLCFLPAFICLGIVPTIAGIADGIFAALP
ncbi:MAG TPA: type II secretion system F family protein [Jatrophihabitantaceae bacterium]|nr:type II secretion system F family protein [Jatrophihabitantaceae bacterium]